MNTEELQKAYDSLKRVHDSMNVAFASMEQELTRVKMQNEVLSTEKKQWEMEKAQQQMIIQNSISQSNTMSNQYLEENIRLKAELKRLKNS